MQEGDGNDVTKVSENQVSIDEVIMNDATNKCPEDNRALEREESSMVSNLPLLFANGYPTSLEKITMAQLERFILFMVHCSLGHDTTKIINKPEWWPQDIKFSSPLTRPKKINENWMANLKKLVFRCYTYHRSEYLLRFCSYLAQYPHEELEYVNNWDSTTSLYHKSTGKLLVTFRNENMYYDRKNDSSRRTLLSHNASSSGYGNKTRQQAPMMIQPCDDIYLCDNCDAEFIGLVKMKEHEKICCELDHGGSGSRSSTPDLTVETELQQNEFLEYFQLFSNKTEVKSIEANSASAPNDNSIVRRTSRRIRNSVNFTRCATIPFSSPAGMILGKKSKAMTEETQQERLDRIERHVIAPVLTQSSRPKWLDMEVEYDRWLVTHKQNRDKPSDEYVHQYKFNCSKNKENKPILSIEAQLLYITCRPIYVVLTRLNEEQIDELKKNPSKYQCPQKNINVRKVLLTRKAGPASRTRLRTNRQNASGSSKRKAPLGDEYDPIIVEDEVISINPSEAKEALIACSAVKSSADNTEATKLMKERKCSPSTIMLINLCSSDEEEDDSSVRTPCDENRDPMNIAESPISKSFVRKVTPKQTLRESLHLPRTLNRLVIEQHERR